ncbi:MAG: HIT domain-containing protein [Minisyncoccia bacterium]
MAEIRIDNARDPEQIRRMTAVAGENECYFCTDFTLHGSAPAVWECDNWFIKINDFPYTGSVHHYLIVSKNHITSVGQMNAAAQLELWVAVAWLENTLGTSGASIFVRTGNMAYNGATLDHLHFHFLVGVEKKEGETEWLTVTLGYKQRK